MHKPKLKRQISDAKKLIGVRFKWAADPYQKSKSFDSSSFTQYLFLQQGIRIPRTAKGQSQIDIERVQ
ncbi:hypothetical protein EHV15_34895 [Paenibacillus oralis]|uniref:NlpC/P60 domain-containing protein n=1 Tax=Paenibacillus oralis TaxID=2490856 RepID=A0A3P3T9S2_9BACL|nr:hypothetical protein EHV15_34895 [Paenibacillus oralis]